MTRLILITPEFGAKSCELPDGTLRVGRAPHNDTVLRDESVSADHCELWVHGAEVIVKEFGSRNGTYVDGVRVKAQSGVNRGQVLRIGRIEVRVDYPEINEDTTADNTAFFAYRKALDPLEGAQAAPAKLPVVFEPEVTFGKRRRDDDTAASAAGVRAGASGQHDFDSCRPGVPVGRVADSRDAGDRWIGDSIGPLAVSLTRRGFHPGRISGVFRELP